MRSVAQLSGLAVLALIAAACALDQSAQAAAPRPLGLTRQGSSSTFSNDLLPNSPSPAVQLHQQSERRTPAFAAAEPVRPPESPSSVAAAVVELTESSPPEDCPITRPSDPAFVPPEPHSDGRALSRDRFFYGTPDLWTVLRFDGTWQGLPYYDGHYTQKVFWWRDGYSWLSEPRPELVVNGRRLDAQAPPLHAHRATNAFNAADIRSAMLTGVGIPTSGCWQITGEYRDAVLSFVVWVAP